MSGNYNTINYKGVRHEKFVYHIFRALLSGPNSTFNHFIEHSRDEWDIGTYIDSGDLIQNETKKYNNTASFKQWTKKGPKYFNIIVLTSLLS